MEFPVTTASILQLPNGIHVILDPDDFAPVVSAQIWVETGSMHEDRLLGSGVSHFLEHMVFKGTKDYGAEELANRVQAAGGHWNAYTTFGRTVYYIDGPSASLDEFLRCLTGLVYFPSLPESEFEREQDVIRREIDMGHDDPDQVASQLLFSAVFQQDPRRHPVIGHRHLFDRLRHEDLVDYHRRRYTAERTFVVVSGDFRPDDVMERLAEWTDGCAWGGGAEPWLAMDPPQLGPRLVREQFEAAATRMNLAWKCPELAHPDAAAWSVLAEILGHGKSSRLYRALRDTGMAMEVSAYAWTMAARDGIVGVGGYVEPGKVGQVTAAVHTEIARLAERVAEEELAKAKRQLSLAQFRSLTSASGRASDLASNWHEARDLNFTRSHLQAIWDVGMDDVRRLAAAMVPGACTTALLEPKGSSVGSASVRVVGKRSPVLERTLEHGLRVAVMRDSRVPTVQLRATWRAGVCSETDATSGLNTLLTANLVKGSTLRSGQEIALALETLGGSLGAAAGPLFNQLQVRGLARDVSELLGLFHEVLVRPSFPAEALEQDRASQLAAIAEAAQDPMHVAMVGLRRAAFGSHGHGRDMLGTVDSVTGLTRRMLLEHHALQVGADGLVITAMGDLEPERMMDDIAGAFAGLQATSGVEDTAAGQVCPAQRVARLAKKQAVVVLGYPAPGILAPERRMVAMLQEYASDMAGPFFTRIREELGLAYQVGASSYLGMREGLLVCYCSTSAEQVEQAREELLQQVARLAAGGIPQPAFDRVRATVLSGLSLQQQSADVLTRQMAVDWHCGRAVDAFTRVAEDYRRITPEQVREIAARLFSAEPVISLVLPE